MQLACYCCVCVCMLQPSPTTTERVISETTRRPHTTHTHTHTHPAHTLHAYIHTLRCATTTAGGTQQYAELANPVFGAAARRDAVMGAHPGPVHSTCACAPPPILIKFPWGVLLPPGLFSSTWTSPNLHLHPPRPSLETQTDTRREREG